MAPIALYPDALVAQVLAAATYPTQVVEADRWRQAQGNAPAEQIAAGAETQNWDPSVKALTAFPTVLAQMDRNLQWTTDLGNAYYNQPQDVMDAVQAMRQKAEAAGQLRSTPQQVVTNDDGAITIAPANPAVVYVPVYDPWVVYGGPSQCIRAITTPRLREFSGADWRSALALGSVSASSRIGLGDGATGEWAGTTTPSSITTPLTSLAARRSSTVDSTVRAARLAILERGELTRGLRDSTVQAVLLGWPERMKATHALEG